MNAVDSWSGAPGPHPGPGPGPAARLHHSRVENKLAGTRNQIPRQQGGGRLQVWASLPSTKYQEPAIKYQDSSTKCHKTQIIEQTEREEWEGRTSVHDGGTAVEHQVALVQRWDMVEQVEGPQVPLAPPAVKATNYCSTAQYQVSGTTYWEHWKQEPNTRSQVPGTKYKVPGIKYQVPGLSYQVSGTRNQVPSTLYQEA